MAAHQMAGQIDLQVFLFMMAFILTTILVALTKRRRGKSRALNRCRFCGRTLDPDKDKDDICLDCDRLGRI